VYALHNIEKPAVFHEFITKYSITIIYYVQFVSIYKMDPYKEEICVVHHEIFGVVAMMCATL